MLRVYTGNSLKSLLNIMNSNISTESGGVLEKVPVCIQTPGMQRWIGINLAEISGISANLDFIFPGALMKRLAGVKAGESSTWAEKNDLIWRVFSKLLNLPESIEYDHIRTYLQNDENSVKSYRLAGRIADTFDQYQVYRPEMIFDWLSPHTKTPPKEQTDLWQMHMVKDIFKDVRCKTSVFHKFMKDCHKGIINKEIIKRPIHIFGISVMPAFFIEMLKAASQFTDINFYLLSPTRQYWGDSKTIRERRRLEKLTDKTAQELYIDEKHELLDNLGVIGRDFFDYIFGSDDIFIPQEQYYDIEKSTLLSTIQAEILDLEYGEAECENDGSITVNSCHNPMREMEALYDKLLELFDRDAELQASDILVMTTDIEKYAPYIKAVFDNPYSEETRIPYSVADVSEKQSSRPAGIFLELLDVLTGDFSLSDVIRILSYEVIAEKFGINTADLSALAQMLANAGAFWSFDAEHLLENGLEIDDTFCWEKALRRVAIGLAEGDTGAIYNDAAAKHVPFSMAEQIGGIMKFADLASGYAKRLRETNTPAGHCGLLADLSADFLSETYENTDDIMYLNRCIANIHEEITESGFKDEIPFEPVMERVTEKLSEVLGAKGFISGRVTFCAMLPMRSIPFKVICIAGLNENTFPRQKISLEFDLMAKHPRPGDRDNRDSDRYLFLETLISAKEHLILSYIGQNERDNTEIPPSTLITELLTHINSRFAIGDITTKHRLHSFSREYFKGERLYTYSAEKYETSKALAGDRTRNTFCEEPLDTDRTESVSLETFENFFVSPPEHFLRNTLGISTKLYDETLPEHELLEADGLLRYSITSGAVNERLQGFDPDITLEYLMKTAQLPPENLGSYYIEKTSERSLETSQNIINSLGGMPEIRNLETDIDGLRITGSIAGVNGGRHIYARPAAIKAKDLIKGWIRHLILNSNEATTTTLMGDNGELTFSPANPENLKKLVSIFRKGENTPLLFHITDALAQIEKTPKLIKKDEYSGMSTDRAFRICFGRVSEPSGEIAHTLLDDMFAHIEGLK